MVKKKNDRVSVRIVENQWVEGKVKQKVICNFGQLHKDEKKEESLQVCIESLEEELRVPMGIDDIFEPTYRQLSLFDGIDSGYKKDQTNDLFKQMVLCRIDDPVSKKKSVETLNREKGSEVNLDQVYRMMDKVFENEKRIKDKIAGRTLSLFKEKIDVTFFDVTTLYFESFIPDELRKCGYSKDNKIRETQVVLALMTTSKRTKTLKTG